MTQYLVQTKHYEAGKLLNVLVTMNGNITILTMNEKLRLSDIEQLVFQIDGDRYQIELDFREIVSYVVGI